MAITNTSLTFTTKDQSIWSPGTAVNLYVDTGDFLIFDSGELSKHWSIDAFIIEASFDTYMSVRFGLLGGPIWARPAPGMPATRSMCLSTTRPRSSVGG